MAAFFHSYVAAVLITKGLPAVQMWISKLIDPDANPRPLPGNSTYPQNNAVPAATTSAPILSPSIPSSLTVPVSLVNETAMRNGLHVNYIASQEGQSHQPTWTVRCLSKRLRLFPGIKSYQSFSL